MRKFRWNIAWVLLAAYVVWQGLVSLLLPSVNDITMADMQGSQATAVPVELPFYHQSRRSKVQINDKYVFTMQLRGGSFVSKMLRIIPDDCVDDIRLNGQPITVPNGQRCRLGQGFVVDMSPYWDTSDNQLVVTITDRGVIYGLTVYPVFLGLNPQDQRSVSLFLALGALLAFLLQRLRFRPMIVAAALICLFASINTMQYSNHTVRAPDWWGHIAYIRHVMANWTVPAPMDGWEYYQQPLYYFITAIVGKIGLWFNVPMVVSARHLALVLVIAFWTYGLLLLRRAISDPRANLLCSLMLLFWPFFMEIAGRINNDMLLYPLWAAFYYYLFCWNQQRQPRMLALALGACAVMLVTKTSAIVPLATLVLAVWDATRKPLGGYAADSTLRKGALAVALALLWNFGRGIYYQLRHPQLAMIISNSRMNRFMLAQYSDNSLWKFTLISPYILFNQPFVTYTNDATGRHYFWQTYFKSMLFGYDSWPYPKLAIALNCVFLLMVIYALVCGAYHKLSRTLTADQRFMALCIVLALASQIGIRLLNTESGTNDARMTFPVMLMFIAYLGSFMQQGRQGHKAVYYGGYGVCGAFLALSAWLMACVVLRHFV